MGFWDFLYIKRNTGKIQNEMIFPKNGILDASVVFVYPGNLREESFLWDNLLLGFELVRKTNAKIIIEESLVPFYIYLGGKTEDVVLKRYIKKYENTIDSVYISFTRELRREEKFIITVLKSKYRYSPFHKEEPFFNIETFNMKDSLEGITLLWNLNLLEDGTGWNIEGKNEDILFSDVYKKSMFEKYSDLKIVLYNRDRMQDNVYDLINAKVRILKRKELKSFCDKFGLEYRKG